MVNNNHINLLIGVIIVASVIIAAAIVVSSNDSHRFKGKYADEHSREFVKYDKQKFNSEDAGPNKSEIMDAIKLTKWAIGLYNIVGREDAIELLNSKEAVFGEKYVFVFDEETGIGIVNPFTTEIIGTDIGSLVDATGREYGKDLLDTSKRGRWVPYLYKAPSTGDEQQKYSFVVSHDGLIFGSGYYTTE